MSAVTIGRPALVEVDLVIVQGADNRYLFRYNTKVAQTLVPKDLTGWTARSQIRKRIGEEVWLSLTHGSGITLGGAAGTVELLIPAATTEATVWDSRGSGVWDLELVDPASKVVRLAQGSVTVSPDVTRV